MHGRRARARRGVAGRREDLHRGSGGRGRGRHVVRGHEEERGAARRRRGCGRVLRGEHVRGELLRGGRRAVAGGGAGRGVVVAGAPCGGCVGRVEEGFAGRRGRFVERGRDAVERAEAEDAAERAGAAPCAVRRESDEPCDVVFVVVDVEAERVGEVLYLCGMSVRHCFSHRLDIGAGKTYGFDEFSESGIATYLALWTADHVVSVGKQSGHVGGRVGRHVEDVPDVLGRGELTPLQGDAKRRVVGGDGNVERANALALWTERILSTAREYVWCFVPLRSRFLDLHSSRQDCGLLWRTGRGPGYPGKCSVMIRGRQALSCIQCSSH